LADRLRNICFIQGLASDQIQTIVQSRNYQNFNEIAETVLVEESAIASRLDRYRLEGTPTQNCSNCGKLGHASNRCYAQRKAEARVNPVMLGGSRSIGQMTSFRCGEKGHVAWNCHKSPRRRKGSDTPKMSENYLRRTERSLPNVASTQ